ncbi:MAG: pyrroline-5-carboxylate reductase [Acidimicrobiales bacterium]|jgi:pyrroline-5-carboxylate reductase|nr:pyrroline-5-carboxylate reductase [Acidimicrobiales bacterium]
MVRLQIVGGGKMGEALLGGLLAAGWAASDDLAVVERLDDRRTTLRAAFPGVAVLDRPVACDGALLAVKPGDVAETCHELALAGVRRVVSIAAGVGTPAIEAALGGGVAVVRAMPNTPAVIGAGASAVAGGTSADPDDVEWALSILGAVGVAVKVAESQLDAVTGLSGSGPAYVFLMAEALIEAGVLVGLSREVAEVLAVQTLLGSARLLESSDEHAAALRAAVTSPGGTTAAGLRVLETGGLRATVLEAVAAATERSAELGRG